MPISEKKMKIVIENYFQDNCNLDTSIHDAFEKGFRIGVQKGLAEQQKPKKGHWTEANTSTFGIYECDVCKGWTYIPNEPRDYNFCPRCGADMREGEKR